MKNELEIYKEQNFELDEEQMSMFGQKVSATELFQGIS